ncbi:hypothetical protein Tco_1331813 [Tanacetum coccineum]
MSSMQEDIQCAGSDTRPPMLDRTDFESWQQRIRLYCLGKDNGENIMKSIKEGPFHMGTTSDVIAAKKENEKEVEVRLRTNKSVWTKVNRVDSSSSSKRVRNNARGNGVAGNVGAQNRGGMINPGQAKPIKMLLMQAQESGAVLDEEQSLFLAGEQVGYQR